MQEILMNTHKFWREIQQTKWHFWEERRVLPFALHYYVQLSFSCILEFPLFPTSLHNTVVVIIYIHKLMLIRILSSDWSISIQVPSKLKKNRMHFYSIQVRSSFLIQVSCMVYTIKKLEWRLGCKTCIVYTGLNFLMKLLFYYKNLFSIINQMSTFVC